LPLPTLVLSLSLPLCAPPLYSLQNPKPPQMTICLWRATIKIGEKRCCLDLIVALPCLESSCKTRGKKWVSGFVGSRLSKTRLMTVKIKKKLTRSHPGLAGWNEFPRVNFLAGFCLNPDRSQTRVLNWLAWPVWILKLCIEWSMESSVK